MQRKISKEKFYNAGKCKTSQDLVHQHMSNHYRKILNAKKAVDNGPPQSYKTKQPITNNNSGMVRNKVNRQLESPALTDRSISTNSNKGSCWGTESYAGSSRYHARCVLSGLAFVSSNKQTAVDMELVNRITYDTKNGPASYCGEGWVGTKSQQNDKDYKPALNPKQSKIEKSSSPTAKRRLPTTSSQESAQKRKFTVQKKLKLSDVTVKGSKSFSSANDKFYTKIFKTNAVSKLRSLRVYHPPRRKPSTNDTENIPNPRIIPLDVSPYKCSKISAASDPNDAVLKKISFNPKGQSLTSSRDSAYNGGISSLPESRSPTPDERKKKICCCCCEKKRRDLKLFHASKTTAGKTVQGNVEPSKGQPQKIPQPLAPETKNDNEQESLRKIHEDELYVKFIQDITTEVLEKNLYTNKALKNVMKKHIKNNLIKLDKDRMLKEVEYLRVQLGIPEDETLLQVEGELEESESDGTKSYPIISDSEFVMPVTVPEEVNPPNEIPKKEMADFSSGAGNEKGSLESESGDDREVLSVIQVTKAIRQKRTEKRIEKIPMVISRENSFDDSDQPFDPKNLSVLKNLKKKIPRTESSESSSSSSSSTSSDSEIFTKKTWEKNEGEISGSQDLLRDRFCQDLCSGKKNRNVSFWKNPELNVGETGRTIEIKQKKTTIRGKETTLPERKEKTKND